MTAEPSPSTLDLGYSFCPNDTFIFYALSHGKTPSPLPVRELLEDVQTLNDWAIRARLPMTKISYRAYFSVIDPAMCSSSARGILVSASTGSSVCPPR